MIITNYIDKDDFIVNNEVEYYGALKELSSIKKRLVLKLDSTRHVKNIIEKNHDVNTYLYIPFASFIKIIYDVDVDLREDEILFSHARKALAVGKINQETLRKLIELYLRAQVSEKEIANYIEACLCKESW